MLPPRALEEALTVLPADAPVGMRAQFRYQRGLKLCHLGRAAEAIDDLVEAVAEFTEVGSPQAVFAQRSLAFAYHDTGRYREAAEVAEEAIPVLDEFGDVQSADSSRWALADTYIALGELPAALNTLTDFRDRSVERDEPACVGEAEMKAAGLLSQLDRDAQAAEKYDAAARAWASVGHPVNEAFCRYEQAMTQHWAGESEAALQTINLAERAIATFADEYPDAAVFHRAQLDFNAARILAGLERNEEAAATAAASADAFRRLGEPDRAGQLDLLRARILADAEQFGPAAALFREVIAAAEPGGPLHTAATDDLAKLPDS